MLNKIKSYYLGIFYNKNKNKITGTNCKCYKNISYFLQLYVIMKND